MYRLAGSFGIKGLPAVLASILFAFNGFIILRVEFYFQYSAYAWIPIILYFFKEGIAYNNIKKILIAALLLAIQYFIGYPIMVLMTMVMLGMIFLVSCFQGSSKQKMILGFVCSGVFIMIILPSLLPFIEFIPVSMRQGGMSYDAVTAYSLNPLEFLIFLLAPLWNKYYSVQSGDVHIVGIYFGIVAVVPFIMGLWFIAKEKKYLWIYPALIVSILLAFGKYTPVYKIFITIFPFFSYMRFPVQWILIFVIFFPIVAGLGCSYINNHRITAILIITILVELILFSNGSLKYINSTFFSRTFPAVEYLKQDNTMFRFSLTPKTRGINKRKAGSYIDGWSRFFNSFYPNTAMIAGLYDADGYEVMRYKAYEDILNYIAKDPESKIIDMLNIKYFISFWKIEYKKYKLAMKKWNMYIYENLDCKPRIYGVRNCTFLPYDKIIAYMDSDHCNLDEEIICDEKLKGKIDIPTGAAETTNFIIKNVNYGISTIFFDVESSCDGFVVIADAWDKSWHVRVNNIKKEIIPVNYCLRGVPVRKGISSIKMYYMPVSMVVGMVASGVILTVIILYLKFGNIIKKRT
ncbi:MAG: hypothetical protein GF384_04675 [Elusimicrobia bacterium]|nr:hypothetical protein [Elusimicrobiota bacterium]